MYAYDIEYTNFNGQKVKRRYYFNITEGEIALTELESDGTWSQTLEQISASNQGSVVVPEFKKIIKWTYGEKSADGETFDKSEAAWARFENSEAWSQLIMDLLTKDNFAATFINNVLPERLRRAQNGFRSGADLTRPVPPAARPVQQETPAQAPVQNYGSEGAQQGGIEQAQQYQQPAPAQPIQVPAPQQAAPLYDVNTQGNFQAPQPLTPEQAVQYQADQGIQRQSTPRPDLQQ
jgi:hypothetical protein